VKSVLDLTYFQVNTNVNKDVLALHYILKLQKLVDWKCASFQICTDNRALGSQLFIHNNSDCFRVWEFFLFCWFDPGFKKWPDWKTTWLLWIQ